MDVLLEHSSVGFDSIDERLNREIIFSSIENNIISNKVEKQNIK